jgi:hypothetical protein
MFDSHVNRVNTFDFRLKPGALHPVANATIKALTFFCLCPPEQADKFNPPVLRVVVDSGTAKRRRVSLSWDSNAFAILVLTHTIGAFDF